MKIKVSKFWQVLVAFMCLIIADAPAQSPDNKTQDSQATVAFKSKDFTTTVNKAYTQVGPSVPLVRERYNLTVKGDSVISNLPYYGRAYSSLPYGGGEGLTFSAKISDYKEEKGKRDTKKVSFTARTKQDKYTFTISVYPQGQTYVRIQANNKQSIAFDGSLLD